MKQLESASPLKVSELADRYKVLADFNGTVLAATQSNQGVQFVTWDWDFDRKGVSHGHYMVVIISERSRTSPPAPDPSQSSGFSVMNSLSPSIVPAKMH